MQILLANPRGFCAGVKRAINIVEYGLKIYGAPIYVHHEIVHNHYVVNNFRKRGVIFIEKIREVPDNAVLIFSAHGVSQAVREEAKSRNFTIFDATCPLVARVHMEVSRISHRREELILIGHRNHPEVKGTLGQYTNPNGKIYLIESQKDAWKLKVKNETHLSFVTQTTLSIEETKSIVDILRKRFPKISGPRRGSNICYATVNRQKATYELAKQADLVLVVGSKNSSNSNRLVELVRNVGKEVFLIENTSDMQEKWIKEEKRIGVTAGASTPDALVWSVLKKLRNWGTTAEILFLNGQKEKVSFKFSIKHSFNIEKKKELLSTKSFLF